MNLRLPLAGALALAFLGRRPQRERMLFAAVAFGAMELLLALTSAIPLSVGIAALCLAGAGFAMTTSMATANTIVQATTPDSLRGRVMSIYMTVFMGTMPIGALLSGATARAFGTAGSIAIGGTVCLLAAASIGVGSWRQGLVAPAGLSQPTRPPHPAPSSARADD